MWSIYFHLCLCFSNKFYNQRCVSPPLGVWFKYSMENHKNYSSNSHQDIKPNSYLAFLIEKVFGHLMR